MSIHPTKPDNILFISCFVTFVKTKLGLSDSLTWVLVEFDLVGFQLCQNLMRMRKDWFSGLWREDGCGDVLGIKCVLFVQKCCVVLEFNLETEGMVGRKWSLLLIRRPERQRQVKSGNLVPYHHLLFDSHSYSSQASQSRSLFKSCWKIRQKDQEGPSCPQQTNKQTLRTSSSPRLISSDQISIPLF